MFGSGHGESRGAGAGEWSTVEYYHHNAKLHISSPYFKLSQIGTEDNLPFKQ
jgi:hypothetical protein